VPIEERVFDVYHETDVSKWVSWKYVFFFFYQLYAGDSHEEETESAPQNAVKSAIVVDNAVHGHILDERMTTAVTYNST
jgi:hypothetical protein